MRRRKTKKRSPRATTSFEHGSTDGWIMIDGEMDWGVVKGRKGQWVSSHHWPMLKKQAFMKCDLPRNWWVFGKVS